MAISPINNGESGSSVRTKVNAAIAKANLVDDKANLNSPALSGTPTAPSADFGDSSEQIATTRFANRRRGEKGADIASASTINLAATTGDYVDVSGTTAINSLGTMAAGIERTLRFLSTLTLTYSTDLVLPGRENIITANGDTAIFRSEGSGKWRCVSYQRAEVPPMDVPIGTKIDKAIAPFLGRNRLKNSDFSKSTAGVITPLSTASQTVPQPGMPSYWLSKSGAAGCVYPVLTVVDNQYNAKTRTKRALKMRHVRSGGGASFTDLQLRSLIPIPAEIVGRTDIEVRLVYEYKRASANVSVSAVCEIFNAAKASIGTVTLTKLSVDGPDGQYGTAVFTGTITNASAAYASALPRMQATADIDEDAYIGPIFVGFNRADVQSYDRNDEEIFRDRLAGYGYFSPLSRGDNEVKNALLMANDIGYTGVPAYFGINTGGGGTTGAAYSIAEIITPLGTDRAFKTDHYNNGTVRTDRQLVTLVDIPKRFHGDTTLVARVVQLIRRSSLAILPSIYTSIGDANAVINGAMIASGIPNIRKDSDNNVDTWDAAIYDVPITNALARKLEVRFRTHVDSASGVVAGLAAYQTGFYISWNKAEDDILYDRNWTYDVGAIADKQIATALTGLNAATLGDSASKYDVYQDARGNVLPIVPSKTINLFGDSQTAAAASVIAGGLPTRTVNDCGIGGETATEVVRRMMGHVVDVSGVSFATSGTKRLKTKRAVPPRMIDEAYRSSWNSLGVRIAEPTKVEFFNASSLIGTSYDQIKAVASVSGATLTAAAHGFANGDEVYILDASRPANMYIGKVYYVRDVTTNTFGLAEYSGGAAISFSAFGGSITVLGGFYLDWAFTTGMNSTISIVTHTPQDKSVVQLMVGTNGIAGDPQVTIAKLKEAVSNLKSFAKRFVVPTIPSFYNWNTATTEYANMVTINNFILREYPSNSIDLYAYLRTKGDGSANDNADIAAGLVPRSLRASATDGHLNSAGAAHWRDLLVAFLNLRGW